ncbi:ficolin-2-like [Anopheles marshallii]|uniref:ficolin-2-like n=1 Tax=Anopheles marshallii TaxID=1521116 RepID=UPI00237A3289|nr:ficolin-2-like [Anopheles marshallii]
MLKKCLLLVLLVCSQTASAQNVENPLNGRVDQCGYALGLVLNKLNTMEYRIMEKEHQIEQKLNNISSMIERFKQPECNTTTLPVYNRTKEEVYSSCKKVPFSGVYKIQPENPFKEPITVLCDQEYESGGWTVIQHRFDGSTNFYRSWQEYKNGFGNLDGEFWLGLDRIYQLTVSRPHELVVLLEDFAGNKTFAWYDHFEIGGESQKYNLTRIDGFSGPAGDCLGNVKGMQFSTFDSDNDTWEGNCAVTYTGAWWYSACHTSNLNGKYLRGETKEYATGMVWRTFREYFYSLKTAKMMIRPKLI